MVPGAGIGPCCRSLDNASEVFSPSIFMFRTFDYSLSDPELSGKIPIFIRNPYFEYCKSAGATPVSQRLSG